MNPQKHTHELQAISPFNIFYSTLSISFSTNLLLHFQQLDDLMEQIWDVEVCFTLLFRELKKFCFSRGDRVGDGMGMDDTLGCFHILLISLLRHI